MGMRERRAQAQEGLSTSSWDVGSTETLQEAVRREKDCSGKRMEQQRGNTQHSVKSQGEEPRKSFSEDGVLFQAVLPTCCRITPGTELCLVPNVLCTREVKDGHISISK